MRVYEEPFLTRDAILAVLRPGQPVSESPFRTLRGNEMASAGIRVDVRTPSGRLLGRTHLYSSLNTDAARAVRRNQPDLARRLAQTAARLERSREAGRIVSAIRSIASAIPPDATGADAPVALQRYVRSRAGGSWRAFTEAALAREWVASSAAWLDRDETGELREAVVEMARVAAEARAETVGTAFEGVATFFGVVRRLDEVSAEIDGDHERRLIARRDLEREGLAVIGQAVSLLCEALPAGGSLVLPMPAVLLEEPAQTPAPDVWDVEHVGEGATPASVLGAADHAWVLRERQPVPVPVAPIPVRDRA